MVAKSTPPLDILQPLTNGLTDAGSHGQEHDLLQRLRVLLDEAQGSRQLAGHKQACVGVSKVVGRKDHVKTRVLRKSRVLLDEAEGSRQLAGHEQACVGVRKGLVEKITSRQEYSGN